MIMAARAQGHEADPSHVFTIQHLICTLVIGLEGKQKSELDSEHTISTTTDHHPLMPGASLTSFSRLSHVGLPEPPFECGGRSRSMSSAGP